MTQQFLEKAMTARPRRSVLYIVPSACAAGFDAFAYWLGQNASGVEATSWETSRSRAASRSPPPCGRAVSAAAK